MMNKRIDSINLENDVAICIQNLSKRYEIYDSPRHRLWQSLALGKKQFFREFWALKDVNLSIRRGETFGIVGRNGAGKSTLLQLVSGILTPTSGSIQTSGRITALLELGAGLNPEFTGLENIRMNAAVTGIPDADLASKMGTIIDFASLGDFIKQPIKHYSSGMIMRLAFATAINFDPDILIVDEALAVGDELFQLKCIRRIQEIKKRGATILFVSHSTHTVNQICDRAVLIDAGRVVKVGKAKAVSEHYNKLLFSLNPSAKEGEAEMTPQEQREEDSADEVANREADTAMEENNEVFRIKPPGGDVSGKGKILEVGVAGQDYRNLNFMQGTHVRFKMKIRFDNDIRGVISGMMITTATGIDCYHTNLLCKDMLIEHAAAGDTYAFEFEMPLNLSAGNYIVVFDCQYDIDATPKLVDIFYEALKFSIPPTRLIDDGGIAALGARINHRKLDA